MRKRIPRSAILFLFLTSMAAVRDTVHAETGLYTATSALNTSATEKNYNRRQKREHDIPVPVPFYPDYPDSLDYDYQMNGPNYILPTGLVGGTGLALKALKIKAKLKSLKFLAVPAGIALLGGIAALANGVSPTMIGGINLPFKGKRKKREVNENYYNVGLPVIHRRKLRNIRNF